MMIDDDNDDNDDKNNDNEYLKIFSNNNDCEYSDVD